MLLQSRKENKYRFQNCTSIRESLFSADMSVYILTVFPAFPTVDDSLITYKEIVQLYFKLSYEKQIVAMKQETDSCNSSTNWNWNIILLPLICSRDVMMREKLCMLLEINMMK